MDNLWPKPSEDTLEWLLEEDNPSVRYFTLTELLGRPPDDPEAVHAKHGIMRVGPVPEILARQQPGGYWGSRDSFYTNKYDGTVWQLIVLAELGADGRDPRIKEACEFIPCLTGNMVYSLAHLGYLGDPRLQRAIDWIAAIQRFDDGAAEEPSGEPYYRYEICFERHTCHMGAVKALKALAAVPEEARSAGVRATIKRGVEYILAHHVHKRSHNLSKVSKPGWLKLCFPQMYQTDVLEILGILTRLGCRDDRMREALEVVAAKRDPQGRWALEASFNDRSLVPVEQKGLPSKWITLKALVTFARYMSAQEGK
jgi:hypothetical protein